MEGRGDVAEIELGFDLSARAKSKGFLGKLWISEVSGVEGPGDVAEIELRLDLSVGAKS